jgi:hypothetical protein
MRKFLSVVAGAAVAIASLLAIETLGHLINPSAVPPGGVPDVAAMNTPAKLWVVAGWFLATLAGAVTALRVSAWRPAAWTVGVLVLAGGVANIVMIPHPFWMQTAALFAPALAVLVAERLTTRRTRAA